MSDEQILRLTLVTSLLLGISNFVALLIVLERVS